MGIKDYKGTAQSHPQEHYMDKALALAQKAFTLNEVPIGALVVAPDGTIIGRGCNEIEQKHQQSAHAEVLAINEASIFWNDWRLKGCWLYVTLEPCTMCMSLIKLSRMDGVVYGASSPLFGYNLAMEEAIPLYKKKSLHIISGIMKESATTILKQFFQKKRESRD